MKDKNHVINTIYMDKPWHNQAFFWANLSKVNEIESMEIKTAISKPTPKILHSMEIENALVSEVTQTQKEKYDMYSLISGF